MRMYTVAISAAKNVGERLYFTSGAGLLIANDDAEATIIARERALIQYPAAYGWGNHQGVPSRISTARVRELLELCTED